MASRFFGLQVNKIIDPITGEEQDDYSEVNNFKKNIYDELFTLSYYGNGGWNWQIAFALPIHIRKYCLRLLKNAKEKEIKEIEENNKSNSLNKVPRMPSSVNSALNKSAIKTPNFNKKY